MSDADAYAAERRRIVLSRLGRRLGGRCAVIGEARLPPRFVPLVTCAARRGDVVSRDDAVPVASGALTGVLLARALDGAAAPALAECARVLQPGGVAIVMGELRDDEAQRELLAAAEACGFELEGRTPVGPLPAVPRLPEGLWRADAAFDRLSVRLGVGVDAPHETAVVLRRAGGDRVEFPGFGEMCRQMVLPRRAGPRWRA